MPLVSISDTRNLCNTTEEVLSLLSFFYEFYACGVRDILERGALGICRSSVWSKNRGPLLSDSFAFCCIIVSERSAWNPTAPHYEALSAVEHGAWRTRCENQSRFGAKSMGMSRPVEANTYQEYDTYHIQTLVANVQHLRCQPAPINNQVPRKATGKPEERRRGFLTYFLILVAYLSSL